jgi:RNA polymerase sigma factor (sigma-70 family)
MGESSSENEVDAKIQRLVEEHLDRIEAAAKRVLQQHYAQAMDDLRQEVRIAIWRALETGQSIEHWGAFIYCCAYKRAVNLLKQTRRRARHEISLGDLTGEDERSAEEKLAIVPVELDGLSQALQRLDEELTKLPEPIRLTVFLRKGEGYSRAEVAQMLHCSEAAVDHRLRQGLNRLRKRLKQCGLQSPQG